MLTLGHSPSRASRSQGQHRFEAPRSCEIRDRRYFAELIAIPRLAARLRAWVVKQRFSGQAADLLERQQRLAADLEVTISSTPLHTTLRLLLALGNTLNAGSKRHPSLCGCVCVCVCVLSMLTRVMYAV